MTHLFSFVLLFLFLFLWLFEEAITKVGLDVKSKQRVKQSKPEVKAKNGTSLFPKTAVFLAKPE